MLHRQVKSIFGMYPFDDVKPDAGDDETPVVYSVAMDAFKIINKKELLCLTLFAIDAQSVADPKTTIVAEATEQRKEENEEYTALMASDSAALEFAKNRLNKFYNPKLKKFYNEQIALTLRSTRGGHLRVEW